MTALHGDMNMTTWRKVVAVKLVTVLSLIHHVRKRITDRPTVQDNGRIDAHCLQKNSRYYLIKGVGGLSPRGL